MYIPKIIKKPTADQLTFYGVLLVFLILAIYLINIFSYFDPLHWCYIGISGDPVSGNEKTIHAAIKLIKKQSGNEYNNLCQYVERINEKSCMGADPRGGEEGYVGAEEAGCYIKGSKVIYLLPEQGQDDFIIFNRAAIIKKYSNYSKNFWENRN